MSDVYSDLALKTWRTRLVIEFKRILETGREETVIREAFDLMKTHHYGETTENKKLIRAAMITCTLNITLSFSPENDAYLLRATA
jgi:hypothetical protein